MASAAQRLLLHRRWLIDRSDPDELRFVATIYVWLRWFVWVGSVIVLLYRPDYPDSTFIAYGLLHAGAVVFNACVHFRLLTRRSFTPTWLLMFCAFDMTLITASVVVSGGYENLVYLLYYPSLAMFALTSSSFKVNLLWVTIVASIYSVVCVATPPGLNYDAYEEKQLVGRLVMMYAVAVLANPVAVFERSRKIRALDRESELQQERIQLSQTIHDTIAQSAFMVGLGIQTARDLAGRSNRELAESLDATYALSQSTMWELRHTIDSGYIFEGRQLHRALRSHVSSFTAITRIPAEFVQEGEEPALSERSRSLLFSIAHNAMTNVFRHAQATRATLRLDCGSDSFRLSISDNGIGLPPDYAQRGYGFRNMSESAEQMGGWLEVDSGPGGTGTTIACEIPIKSNLGAV